MIYLVVLSLFLFTLIFIYGVLTILNRNKISILNRMEQIDNIAKNKNYDIDKLSFLGRVIKPFYSSIAIIFSKSTSNYKLEQLSKKLERAGFLKKYTAEKWIFNKLLTSIIFSVLIGLFAYTINPNISKSITIMFLCALLISRLFEFALSSKITSRKIILLRDLPYTLDLITVSVEAGLSFDGAITRVINNINGELCDEFGKTLKEMRMGLERKVALKNMSERCDVRDLSILLTSLIQADELGVSLGRVLRIEAAQLREHRKQAAREKAMKAPIKMLFPLMFFIFPAIFIIILGPAIIKIFAMF